MFLLGYKILYLILFHFFYYKKKIKHLRQRRETASGPDSPRQAEISNLLLFSLKTNRENKQM